MLIRIYMQHTARLGMIPIRKQMCSLVTGAIHCLQSKSIYVRNGNRAPTGQLSIANSSAHTSRAHASTAAGKNAWRRTMTNSVFIAASARAHSLPKVITLSGFVAHVRTRNCLQPAAEFSFVARRATKRAFRHIARLQTAHFSAFYWARPCGFIISSRCCCCCCSTADKRKISFVARDAWLRGPLFIRRLVFNAFFRKLVLLIIVCKGMHEAWRVNVDLAWLELVKTTPWRHF